MNRFVQKVIGGCQGAIIGRVCYTLVHRYSQSIDTFSTLATGLDNPQLYYNVTFLLLVVNSSFFYRERNVSLRGFMHSRLSCHPL